MNFLTNNIRHSLGKLAALVLVSVLLSTANHTNARGFVAVGGGGRGFVAAGGGYGYHGAYAYRGYGYGGGVVAYRAALPYGYHYGLPAGAVTVSVMGNSYYYANGVYYAPQFYGGSTVYVVSTP